MMKSDFTRSSWPHLTVVSIGVAVLCIAVAFANPLDNKRYDDWFEEYTALHFHGVVSPNYPKAVAIAESALNPLARSHVGAAGLMQFMPATWTDVAPEPWRSFGALNPEAAIWVGCKYLAWQFSKFKNARGLLQRKAFASAGYNSGLGNVLKARAVCRDREGYLTFDDRVVPMMCCPEIWDEPHVSNFLVTCPSCQIETRTYITRIRRWEQRLAAAGAFL